MKSAFEDYGACRRQLNLIDQLGGEVMFVVNLFIGIGLLTWVGMAVWHLKVIREEALKP